MVHQARNPVTDKLPKLAMDKVVTTNKAPISKMRIMVAAEISSMAGREINKVPGKIMVAAVREVTARIITKEWEDMAGKITTKVMASREIMDKGIMVAA